MVLDIQSEETDRTKNNSNGLRCFFSKREGFLYQNHQGFGGVLKGKNLRVKRWNGGVHST